ncbi:MAG: VanZ family protein [Pirellulaceae bacterium]
MLRMISLGTLGVYWIAIFVGTHMPHGVRGPVKVHDKVLHFGAYAGLAFLLAAALTTMRMRYAALLLPLIVAAIYGCIDELSQNAVPGRQADFADWVADVLGAGVGVLTFAIISLALARLFAPPASSPREAVAKSAA